MKIKTLVLGGSGNLGSSLKKNNFFTLNKMLQNTLSVYEKVIKEKGEASLDKKRKCQLND